MSWRNTQLGSDLCDQDQLILDLIGKRSVRIYGNDAGFAQFCTVDPESDFCLLYFNQKMWLSQIHNWCKHFLTPEINYCYLGINRYTVLGNDTVQSLLPLQDNQAHGQNLLDVISRWLSEQGFNIIQTGTMDQDRGRFFNFVQPLTWIYAQR